MLAVERENCALRGRRAAGNERQRQEVVLARSGGQRVVQWAGRDTAAVGQWVPVARLEYNAVVKKDDGQATLSLANVNHVDATQGGEPDREPQGQRPRSARTDAAVDTDLGADDRRQRVRG